MLDDSTPAKLRKLQANAAEIRNCSVALQDVVDWDAPAAMAILEQLDALADDQARISGLSEQEIARIDAEAELAVQRKIGRDTAETLRAIKVDLPRQTVLEIKRILMTTEILRFWGLIETEIDDYREGLRERSNISGFLEMLKPGPMGGGAGGFYAGPAFLVSPETVLIILFYKKIPFVLPVFRQPEDTLGVQIRADAIMSRDRNESPSGAAVTIKDLFEKHGRAAGQGCYELTGDMHEYCVRVCLFASMPDEARASLVNGLETVIAAGLCPILVGLLGEGSETGPCVIWPLLLGLVPYANTIIKE